MNGSPLSVCRYISEILKSTDVGNGGLFFRPTRFKPDFIKHRNTFKTVIDQ